MTGIVRSIGKTFTSGLGVRKSFKKDRPDIAVPDEDELKRTARKRFARLSQRGGRRSTILDQETLG